MLGSLLQRMHDALNVGCLPEPADCIFTHAGRPERKAFALELYRAGYAPRVIFSVGRFEWRGFARLGLPTDGGLGRLVADTPPAERHFFVEVGPGGTACRKIPIGKLGTLSEARSLARFLEEERLERVLLVSSGYHLRRAQRALKACSSHRALTIIPVPAPEEDVRVKRQEWWQHREGRALILKEYLKNALYAAVLSLRLPESRPATE